MGKYIKGNVDEVVALGTLASRTLVAATFGDTVNERTKISSIVAAWSLSGYTGGDNIGPILVGVAHSDYSAAEIEAVIENSGSWSEGDLIAQEVVSRKIRIVGTMGPGFSDAGPGDAWVLNGGRPFKTKLNWMLLQGQTLDLWAYNLGGSPLATTDPDLRVEGHANLWPQ